MSTAVLERIETRARREHTYDLQTRGRAPSQDNVDLVALCTEVRRARAAEDHLRQRCDELLEYVLAERHAAPAPA